MPPRPGDGAGGRDHGAPYPAHRSRLFRFLPGLSRGGNVLLGIVLAVFVGLAQLPPFNGPALGADNVTGSTSIETASINGSAAFLRERAPRRPLAESDGAVSATVRSLPPEQLKGYRWPLAYASITTWFAPTNQGFVVIGGKRVHDGIDLATFCGDVVRAAHAGTVLHAGREFDRYLGYSIPPEGFYNTIGTLAVLPIVVVVDDGNGYRSVYVHLSEAYVRPGQGIRPGDPIGREGATGHATGCHLHYSLIRMDGTFQPVARELVIAAHYPKLVRERVDPLRVLSFLTRGAPRQLPGIPPPAHPIR